MECRTETMGTKLNKAAIRRELEGKGKWDEFVAYREGLVKHGGASRPEAWLMAVTKFTGIKATDGKTDETDKANQGEEAGAANSPGTVLGNPNPPDDFRSDALVDGKLFENKPEIPQGEIVDWVFNHLGVANVRPEDCPSAGAWKLLQWARKPVNETEFWRMWAKRIPNKSQTDGESNQSDDGRKEISIIDRVRAAGRSTVLQPGSEGV